MCSLPAQITRDCIVDTWTLFRRRVKLEHPIQRITGSHPHDTAPNGAQGFVDTIFVYMHADILPLVGGAIPLDPTGRE